MGQQCHVIEGTRGTSSERTESRIMLALTYEVCVTTFSSFPMLIFRNTYTLGGEEERNRNLSPSLS